jgi:type IV pilus assembly protein PilO
MELSLSKLPWQAQIGAFVVVCASAVFGFWNFYVAEMQSDISMRQSRLTALRADITKGNQAARRLPEFQAQVDQLEDRLESLAAVLPEQKDVADILRRLQGLAAQSNLSIQRFTPQPAVQQALYAEVPFKLQAEGSYHSLGHFFDRISKFPRIINVSNISIRANNQKGSEATIVAECIATTFVLQEGVAKRSKNVPKQPGAAAPAAPPAAK